MRLKHKELIIKVINVSHGEFEKMREEGIYPELELWETVFEQKPTTIFEFLHCVEEFTGWNISSAEDFVLGEWPIYRKLMGIKAI